MKVHEKLLDVQAKLKAPKGQYNDFGKYAYRNAEDILEALKPLLAEVKATNVISDDIVLIGDRFYIKATATFTDVETGESVSASSFAREELTKKGMDSSQITGSTSSYARKYALNGLYGIDDNKDADHPQEQKTESEKVEPMATPKQIELLKQKLTPERIDAMLKNYKVEKIEQFPMRLASAVLAKLEKEKA